MNEDQEISLGCRSNLVAGETSPVRFDYYELIISFRVTSSIDKFFHPLSRSRGSRKIHLAQKALQKSHFARLPELKI